MRRFILLLVITCFAAGTFQAKVPVADNKIRLTDNWEYLGTGSSGKERAAGGTADMDKGYPAPLLQCRRRGRSRLELLPGTGLV